MKTEHTHTIPHEACLDCWSPNYSGSYQHQCVLCNRRLYGGTINLCNACLEDEYLRLKVKAGESL